VDAFVRYQITDPLLFYQRFRPGTSTDARLIRQNGQARIQSILCCPNCRASVERRGQDFRCEACDQAFPIDGGILRFEKLGTAETWGEKTGNRTSQKYQQQYNLEGRAQNYNQKYEAKFFKRMSTRREYAIIGQLLSRQGRCEQLLDLPCGGGRLSEVMVGHTDLLIECDASVGQVRHAQSSAKDPTPRVYMTGSAFHIPLADASVDGVVCVRLNHHLPTNEERERLMRELLRVARRFVMMTYFDFNSVKNRWRRIRNVARRKRDKKTMKYGEVARIAAECGAKLITAPHLAFIGSGHRYALMRKRG